MRQGSSTILCTACSALLGILHIPGVARLSDHPLIQRLLKGIYHNRPPPPPPPPKPRYAFIWDSDKVIHYLATLNTDDLDFQMLSYKCVTLLTLLSGQRVSTLHKFKCSSLQLTDRLAQFQVVDLLKHSTPHHKQQPALFPSYPYNLNLCPVKTISQYLTVRGKLQAPPIDNVFRCHRKPYGPASGDTLSCWVKRTLQLAGIDTGMFKAHSCQAAATSKADSKGLPLKHILMAGQWSKKTNFYRVYCKMI